MAESKKIEPVGGDMRLHVDVGSLDMSDVKLGKTLVSTGHRDLNSIYWIRLQQGMSSEQHQVRDQICFVEDRNIRIREHRVHKRSQSLHTQLLRKTDLPTLPSLHDEVKLQKVRP